MFLKTVAQIINLLPGINEAAWDTKSQEALSWDNQLEVSSPTCLFRGRLPSQPAQFAQDFNHLCFSLWDHTSSFPSHHSASPWESPQFASKVKFDCKVNVTASLEKTVLINGWKLHDYLEETKEAVWKICLGVYWPALTLCKSVCPCLLQGSWTRWPLRVPSN